MTKYELRRYRYICQEAEQIREQIENIRALMTAPKSQVITGMPRGGGGNGDKIGEAISRIDKLERRYAKKINELLEERKHIENVIEQLDNIERLLIRYKYFDGKTWDEVADKIDQTIHNTYAIHRKILQKISKSA